MAKVMVGMSGGVDSSVAAKLLQDEGYEVTGVTLKLFDGEDVDQSTRTCCSLSDVEDARSVAYKLGFDHLVFNFKTDFRKNVMEHFIDSYLKGETPNPCIECNKHIKFDKMLRRAEELGYDYIATGHYAVRQFDEKTGKYLLIRPADRSKDQTYVLYGLTQYQLSKTLFPLGEYDKTTVRKIAEEAGLVNSRKPDSQDICFIPDGDYAAYLEQKEGLKAVPGHFVDLNGTVLGEHKGIFHYTVGQRKGLGLSMGHPVFVVDIVPETNEVVIGENADTFAKELIADKTNFMSVEKPEDGMQVTAKIRYAHKGAPCRIYMMDEDRVRVVFDEPVRAATKGQAVVFYEDDYIVGGGTITEIVR